MPITRKNHYVPRLYLKNFADPRGFTRRYSLLSSSPDTNPWKKLHLNNVAFHYNLYTFAGGFDEDDDLERWFCKEFEDKANLAIQSAIHGQRLSPDDWRTLSDFVALQIVRTPAFYSRSLSRWNKLLPSHLNDTMERLRQHIEAGTLSDEKEDAVRPRDERVAFPIKVTQEDNSENAEMAFLKAETVVGRPLWRYEMKHLLSYPKNIFYRHRWTILHAPAGVVWPTTDDPVLTLNYNSPSRYDFDGGWNREGSEIILPLSPTRALYTQIGRRVPTRGTEINTSFARTLKALITHHAYREVYAPHEDREIAVIRPRSVRPDLILHERQGWEAWHREHSAAEQDIFENHRKRLLVEPEA